ncbi:MAG: OmpA family protein [Neomegalonema sp.]|nr:OmpA family protein [Neomegalonema sp.]
MTENKEEKSFCWRCLLLALLPLLALFGLGYWATNAFQGQREQLTLQTASSNEELSDLQLRLTDLQGEIEARDAEIERLKTAAPTASADLKLDAARLRSGIAALPQNERSALLGQFGFASQNGLKGWRSGFSALSDQDRSQFFASAPQMDGFSSWFAGLSGPERQQWLSKLPGAEDFTLSGLDADGLSGLTAPQISARFKALQGRLAKVDEEVAELKADKARLSADLQSAQSAGTRIDLGNRGEMNVSALPGLVRSLDGEIEEQNISLANLRRDLDASKSREEEMTEELAGLRSRADTVDLQNRGSMRVAALPQLIRSLDAKTSEQETQITQLRQALAAAQGEQEAARLRGQSTTLTLPGRGTVSSDEVPRIYRELRDELVATRADLNNARVELDALRNKAGSNGDIAAQLDATRKQLADSEIARVEIGKREEDLRIALGKERNRADQAEREMANLRREANARGMTPVRPVARREAILQSIRERVLPDSPTRSGLSNGSGPVSLASSASFNTGSSELRPEGQAILDEFADVLLSELDRDPSASWVLLIEGHTDSRPISNRFFASNWELSASRAATVARYLTERGIPSERLRPVGRAEFDPADLGTSEEAYARNRRIEFDIVAP